MTEDSKTMHPPVKGSGFINTIGGFAEIHIGDKDYPAAFIVEAVAAHEAALAAAPVNASMGEDPVAWQVRDPKTGGWVGIHVPEFHRDRGTEMRPLYTTPRPTSELVAALREALEMAVGMLAPYEPGDSRAVSDEFVALASIVAGCDNEECWRIVQEWNERERVAVAALTQTSGVAASLPTAGVGVKPTLDEVVSAIEGEFDEWIKATGAISPSSSWYHEAKSFIRQAAESALTPIEGV